MTLRAQSVAAFVAAIISMTAGAPTGSHGMQEPRCCPVVELRQYQLHPGRRDELIELFDREFVETQEAVGMSVIAQFRDLARPDVFVWLRGFPDMVSRARSLNAFYKGPVWAAHGRAANATMINSDDVHLLRPLRPGSGFSLGGRARTAGSEPAELIVATIYRPVASLTDFAAFFESAIAPRLAASGSPPIAILQTEPSENTFPGLPVHEGVNVLVWFARFDGQEAYKRHLNALAADRIWHDEVARDLGRRLAEPPTVLRLKTTARSHVLR